MNKKTGSWQGYQFYWRSFFNFKLWPQAHRLYFVFRISTQPLGVTPIQTTDIFSLNLCTKYFSQLTKRLVMLPIWYEMSKCDQILALNDIALITWPHCQHFNITNKFFVGFKFHYKFSSKNITSGNWLMQCIDLCKCHYSAEQLGTGYMDSM